MRWLALFVLVLTPALAPAQEGEAEKVYRAMEKKILAAKSLAVEFKVKMEIDNENTIGLTLEGSCHVAAGNKVRFEVEQDFPALKSRAKILSVTNGESVYQKVGNDVLKKTDPSHKAKAVLGVMARMGAAAAFMEKKTLQAFEQDKGPPAKDLKLGAKEMVDKREAQVVRYRIEDKDSKEGALVSVWIDTKTHLPLKRVIVGEKAGKKDDTHITETYSVFTLDSKLDGKLFDIPKKE